MFKKKTNEPEFMSSDAQPLTAHLLELRRRLIASLALLLVCFFAAYHFAPDIYQFLLRPLHEMMPADEGRRLIYTGLTEAFLTYLKLSLWVAFFVTLPFIATQIWLFVAPGLYYKEKQAFLPFLLMTPIMFGLGAALAYFYVIPVAWHFFLSFEMQPSPGQLPIQLEARVSEYLNLTMALVMAFGMAFLLPIGLVLLVRVGILSVKQLREWRRFAIVINFIIAAILTPPDILSQFTLAIPLIILYELAILAASLLKPRARPETIEEI
jgi:sec-independent protein translocase protein TatC